MEAVLTAARAAGAAVELVQLGGDGGPLAAVERVIAARDVDGYVIGSPVYRASFATPLKAFLDALPRGVGRETEAPLRGKAVVIVATGGSWHHFLALNDLRNVLAGFFATHVVPPGLYVGRGGFSEDGALQAEYQAQAEAQGRALVELGGALGQAAHLRDLRPQV